MQDIRSDSCVTPRAGGCAASGSSFGAVALFVLVISLACAGPTDPRIQTGPDAVVTMGCGDACPHIPAKDRRDWDLTDPRDLERDAFNEVRDDISRRVRALVAEISGPGGL